MWRTALLLLAISLAGCSNGFQRVVAVYQAATEATIDPAQAYVGVNAFDGIKVTATKYFEYCAGHLTVPACDLKILRPIDQSIVAGTRARNQLKVYMQTSAPLPSQLYNIVIAAVNGWNASPASQVQVP